MQIIRTLASLRSYLTATDPSTRDIGFVPTMGALHEGHLSLVRAARERHATVVMSIFVNPKQFEGGEDFSSYPRDEFGDLDLARAAGVDAVFLPDAAELYPDGFATTVSVDARLTSVLEGEVRGAGHFDGMTTIVTKLLLAVMPDAAYFGAKDFQQLVIVRRCVADLGLQVRIVSCPTVREADGLAISSRNVRLTPDERSRAVAIPEALTAIADAVRGGERDVEVLRPLGLRILAGAGLEVEYLAFVHADTLQAVNVVTGITLCAVAVVTESTRLIDNELLVPPVSEGNASVT